MDAKDLEQNPRYLNPLKANHQKEWDCCPETKIHKESFRPLYKSNKAIIHNALRLSTAVVGLDFIKTWMDSCEQ